MARTPRTPAEILAFLPKSPFNALLESTLNALDTLRSQPVAPPEALPMVLCEQLDREFTPIADTDVTAEECLAHSWRTPVFSAYRRALAAALEALATYLRDDRQWMGGSPLLAADLPETVARTYGQQVAGTDLAVV